MKFSCGDGHYIPPLRCLEGLVEDQTSYPLNVGFWFVRRLHAASARPECPKIRLRRAAAAWIEEFGDCPPLASCSSPPAPTTAAATDSAVATACAAATAGEAATAGAAAPRPVRLTKRKEERCETRRSIMRDLETIS